MSPTKIEANSTIAATTTATAIAIILPEDIFALGTACSEALVPVAGIKVMVLVTTEPPIVCNDCVVTGVVILDGEVGEEGLKVPEGFTLNAM